MEFLSRLLSSLIIGLIALPAFAYIPDALDLSYNSLSETQKFLIRNGQTIPYNKTFVKRVVVGKAKIMPNGAIINIPHGPEFVPSFHDLKYNEKWQNKELKFIKELKLNENSSSYQTNFLIIHALDVYSTYKGLKYSCISEANPLVGKYPSLAELILFKVIMIAGFEAVYDDFPVEWDFFQKTSSYMTGAVVINNYQITKEAKENPRCKKR
jgi:hypothetical protein